MGCPQHQYLCHVYGACSQRLVAPDRAVLVPLPPLQQDLELVSLSLQEMRVLRERDGVGKSPIRVNS